MLPRSVPILLMLLQAAAHDLRAVFVFAVNRLLPRRERKAFVWGLVLAIFVRLPFWFTSTDGYMRDGAVTFHDEAIFMQLGLDVLQGRIPYIYHWDPMPPMGWLASALLMLLSFGSLTLVRLWASVYVAATAYVVFRALADLGLRRQAKWSACFYIVFASTLQAGQSFTVEHLLALPLASLLYILLHPQSDWRQSVKVLLLFAVCCALQPSFCIFAAAIAVLYPALYTCRFSVRFLANRLWLSSLLVTAASIVCRSCMLLTAAGLCHLFFYFCYFFIGEGYFYLVSLLDAPQLLKGNRMLPITDFISAYAYKLYESQEWLLIGGVIMFMIKYALALISGTGIPNRVFYVLLICMVAGMAVVHARGNHGSLFFFYFIQVLPVFAMVLGLTLCFDYQEAHWFVIASVLLGLYQTSTELRSQYTSLVREGIGDNSHTGAFYDDRLYRSLNVMQAFPLEDEALVICGEDDMLYPMTGMDNPRYFLFPFYQYNTALHHVLQRPFGTLRDRVLATKPLYIIGREGDGSTRRGFAELSDVLFRDYVQVANIDTTLIYVRRNAMKDIFLK